MYNPYYYHMNKNANRRANNNQDNNHIFGEAIKDNSNINTKTTSYDKGFNLGEPAPEFTLQGIVNGQPKEVSLSDYRGKWVVVFFYGSDFTFV